MTGTPPLPGFDADWYTAAYPDVPKSGLAAAEHYRRIGARLGRPPRPDCINSVISDYAVIMHAYHLDCLSELKEALALFPPWIDVYVSYPEDSPDHSSDIMKVHFPYARLIPVRNIGQDIGAFFQVMGLIDTGRYTFLCKMHSKKGDKHPSIWRDLLIAGIAGTARRIDDFVQLFREDPDIVIGGSSELFLNGKDYLMGNREGMNRILSVMDLPCLDEAVDWGFFAGSMLWIRHDLADWLSRSVAAADFLSGDVKRDGQLAHAVERLLGMIPSLIGKKIALASSLAPERTPDVLSAQFSPPTEDARPMMERLNMLHSRRFSEQNDALLAGTKPGLGFTRTFARVQCRRLREFSIVTPTGDRLAAFNRCVAMVTAQTIKPKEWIVVDDGLTPLVQQMPLPEGVRYIRRPPAADDPPHTLARNMLAALEHVTTNRVLIIEDDDWYSPLYAEYILPFLDHYDMVGLNPIHYYHLGGRAWKTGMPPSHTAFAQTAFRRGHAWDHLAAVCRTDFPEIRERGIVDRHWWQTYEGFKLLLPNAPGLHVGFKGGFGRRGLASGHERREVDYIEDPELVRLQNLIGADLPTYSRWTNYFRKPYAVYTSLAEREICSTPPKSVKQADFFAFTDQPKSVAAPWQALPLDSIDVERQMVTARPKMLPHLYFPEYEWSCWISAEHGIAEDLDDLFAYTISAQRPLSITRNPAGRIVSIMRRHSCDTVIRAMVSGWNDLREGRDMETILFHETLKISQDLRR